MEIVEDTVQTPTVQHQKTIVERPVGHIVETPKPQMVEETIEVFKTEASRVEMQEKTTPRRVEQEVVQVPCSV